MKMWRGWSHGATVQAIEQRLEEVEEQEEEGEEVEHQEHRYGQYPVLDVSPVEN